jgi:hypothetical protein
MGEAFSSSTEDFGDPEGSSPNAFKVIHLSGGLRCSVQLDDQRLDIWPLASNQSLHIKLKNTLQFVSILKSCGLDVIGIEEGILLPQRQFTALWQVSPHIVGEIDPKRMPASFWAGVKAAAREAKNIELDSISSSIAFSLTAMQRHLLALSREYNRELHVALERGAKRGSRFASVETYDLWLAVHAFLLAAGSARDYLSQALVAFVFNNEVAKAGKKPPDSMAGLLKHGKKLSYLDRHPIGRLLIEVTDEADAEAWLANLSAYRNIITHQAPITHFSQSNLLELVHTGALGQHDVLQVALLLPKEPRSSNEAPLVDAPTMMKYYNEKMMDLALEIGKLMPYPAMITELTEADIVRIERLD